MNKGPLVSVLMPAFNVEKYIDQAINSILSQSFTDFEFIILDDGSTDSTRELIQSHSDPRIIKVFLDKNNGLVSARNQLVSMARGKYLAFLDSDDIAAPERLSIQLEYLTANNLDLCGTDHLVLFEKNGKIKRSKQRHSDADIRGMISVCSPLCNPSVMGLSDIFKNTPYQTDNDGAEDYVMWVSMALNGHKFGNVPKNLITYRVHDSQISQVQNSSVNLIFERWRARYLSVLGIGSDLVPRRLNWYERIKIAPQFLFALNKKIPGISIAANYQIYSRFQFRANGVWTVFTRLERFSVALLASGFGLVNSVFS